MPELFRVHLQSIEATTLLGCLPRERQQPQKILLDLRYEYDAERAVNSDDLHHAIDYVRVVESLRNFSENHTFYLLETYVERLLKHLLSEFPFENLELSATKPSAIAGACGVRVERSSR